MDAQAGAYATGVLAFITSAAVAVTLTEWRRGHHGAAGFFGVVAVVFIYTITVTILDRPEGLVKNAPVRFIANKIQAGDHEEY